MEHFNSLQVKSVGDLTSQFSKLTLLSLVFLFIGEIDLQAQEKLKAISIDYQELINQKSKLKAATFEKPEGPNPMVSTLPPFMKVNYRAWANYGQKKAMAQGNGANLSNGKGGPSTEIDERENTPGKNDTQKTGQRINQIGTVPGQPDQVFIHGFLGDPDSPPIAIIPMNSVEDDGSIPFATVTGIIDVNQGVSYNETIGDSPGRINLGVADFDMYALTVEAGTNIEVTVNTPLPFGDLDPTVGVFFSDGTLIAFNDDGIPGTFDSFLSFAAPFDGTYYISVGGFGAFIPSDPFDSNSGAVTGAIGSEGTYEAIIRTIDVESDFYVFNLQRGDVFGAAFLGEQGGAYLSIKDLKGNEVVGTAGNASSLYPASNPLPRFGQTAINYTVEESGQYAIQVTEGSGAYTLELFATRPYFELNPRSVQVIYVDYSGGDVDIAPIFEIPFPIVVNQSPFVDFLPNWGLSNASEDVLAITQKITDVVRENLDTDFNSPPVNPKHRVIVTDNFRLGQDNELGPDFVGESISQNGINYKVSRVKVSGTIPETLINTIGIAQSIDPGNFGTEELALVLLDIVSAPFTGASANNTFRINDIVLAPGKTIEDAVVTVIGNITSHEAGHYLGNWHLDGFSNIQGIMDEGPGGMFNLAGIGPSGVFGAPDQTDVDFVTDAYSTSEPFSGFEDTEINSAYSLTFIPANNARFRTNSTGTESIEKLLISGELFQSYPNYLTTSGRAQIKFNIGHDEIAFIKLYDSYGRHVTTLFSGFIKSDQEYSVDLDAQQLKLKPGIYFYRLETTHSEKTQKLLIH